MAVEQRVDLVQQPRALLDQKITRVGQRGEFSFRGRFDARLGQHVLGQEEGKRPGSVLVGFLHRLANLDRRGGGAALFCRPADRLLHQARLALDPDARLKIVRKMYDMRFGEPAPERRSVDQLRGIEGAQVKRLYEVIARQHSVNWKARRYEPGDPRSKNGRSRPKRSKIGSRANSGSAAQEQPSPGSN